MQRNWWFLTDIANPVSRMTAAYNPLFTALFCQHSNLNFSLKVQFHSTFSQCRPRGLVVLLSFVILITPSKTSSCLASACTSSGAAISRAATGRDPAKNKWLSDSLTPLRICVWSEEHHCRGGDENMVVGSEMRAGMPTSWLGSKLPWTWTSWFFMLYLSETHKCSQNSFQWNAIVHLDLPLTFVLSKGSSVPWCRLLLHHLYFSTNYHNCSWGLCYAEGQWLYPTYPLYFLNRSLEVTHTHLHTATNMFFFLHVAWGFVDEDRFRKSSKFSILAKCHFWNPILHE